MHTNKEAGNGEIGLHLRQQKINVCDTYLTPPTFKIIRFSPSILCDRWNNPPYICTINVKCLHTYCSLTHSLVHLAHLTHEAISIVKSSLCTSGCQTNSTHFVATIVICASTQTKAKFYHIYLQHMGLFVSLLFCSFHSLLLLSYFALRCRLYRFIGRINTATPSHVEQY